MSENRETSLSTIALNYDIDLKNDDLKDDLKYSKYAKLKEIIDDDE